MSAAHLQLMSKQRLIAIIAATEKRAQQNAELADYWRSITNGLIDTAPKPDFVPSPETTMAEARRILRSLPVDPLAQEHRDELRAVLNLGGAGNGARKGQRLPGPRCAKGCDQRLNEYGHCPRCESAKTRKLRAGVAA